MRHIERALIPLTVLLVAATAYVGGVVHVRAQTWEEQPDFSARSGVSTTPETPSEPVAHAVTVASTPDVVVETPQPVRSLSPMMRARVNAPAVQRQVERALHAVRPRQAQPPRRAELRKPAVASSLLPRPGIGSAPTDSPRPMPMYVVRIGALRTEQSATDVAARLARRGYNTSVAIRTSAEVARYVVVSELLRREIAEHRAKMHATARTMPTVRARDNDRAQIVYGLYSSQEEADEAARRIRRQGTTALVVVEGGTSYVVSVGPHAKARIDEVVASLSGARYEIEVESTP